MGVVNKKEEINRFDSDGKKDGVWKEYYENGKIKLEHTFFHGEKDAINVQLRKKVEVDLKDQNGVPEI